MNLRKTVDFAITLTLHPRLFSLSIDEQYDIAKKEFLECLKKRKFDIRYTIIAELTMAFNIHLHGIMCIVGVRSKCCLAYLNDLFRQSKIFGRQRLVKVIDDFDKWMEYLAKDYKKTWNALHCRNPIMFDTDDEISTDIAFEIFQLSDANAPPPGKDLDKKLEE